MKPSARAFQDYFSSLYPKDEPGFAAAVIHRGKTLFQGGFGLADLATQEPITSQTRLPIGSNSKLFTAAMVYLLEADGKLKSSDPVLKHLPYLPAFFKPVRLSHFIHHSSGLTALEDLWRVTGLDPRRPIPPEQEALPMIRRMPGLQDEPGTAYRYNNVTYSLLAKVVEKVGGSPFEMQLEARLFKPLGMPRTRLPTPRRLQGQYLRARAYEKFSTGRWISGEIPIRDPGALYMMSPLEDMVSFVKRLRDPGPFAELFKRMQKGKAPLDHSGWLPVAYGGGLRLLQHPRAGRTVFHGGVDGAFHSDFFWMPELDLGLVLLGNRGDFWGWPHFDRCLDIAVGKKRQKSARAPRACGPLFPADAPAAAALRPGFYRSVEDGGKELWQVLPGPGKHWTVKAGWGGFQIEPWLKGAFVGQGHAKATVFLPYLADGALALGEFKQGSLSRTLKPLQSGAVQVDHAGLLGRYFCPQIPCYYTVKRHGRGLRLQMPPSGRPKFVQMDGRLQNLGGDRFMGVIIRMLEQGRELRGELVFKRERGGKVSGFTLKCQDAWMQLKDLEFKRCV